VAHAIDVPDSAALGFGTDIAIYGDPDADDPWSASVAVTHLAADEELLGGLPPDGEAVTVGSHEARLLEAESEVFWARGPDGPGWQVVWTVDGGRLAVTGSVTRDEVLAAAEAATTEPAIEGSGLPDGYEELARGPLLDRLPFTSLFEGNVDSVILGSADGTGLAVVSADPSDRDAVRTAVVVAQRPGPASAVDLLRLSFPDAEATTVRGRLRRLRHRAVADRRRCPGRGERRGPHRRADLGCDRQHVQHDGRSRRATARPRGRLLGRRRRRLGSALAGGRHLGDRRGSGRGAGHARDPRGRGWSRRVVAGSFPMDHFAPASDVVVVARDADGREVGRNSTVLGTDG
jgi:hypothetical protein